MLFECEVWPCDMLVAIVSLMHGLYMHTIIVMKNATIILLLYTEFYNLK